MTLSKTEILSLTQRFQLLSNETRLRILTTLRDAPDDQGLSVDELARSVGRQAGPPMSHVLTMLRVSRLVDSIRDGRNIRYVLRPDGLAIVAAIDGMLGTLGAGKVKAKGANGKATNGRRKEAVAV